MLLLDITSVQLTVLGTEFIVASLFLHLSYNYIHNKNNVLADAF